MGIRLIIIVSLFKVFSEEIIMYTSIISGGTYKSRLCAAHGILTKEIKRYWHRTERPFLGKLNAIGETLLYPLLFGFAYGEVEKIKEPEK